MKLSICILALALTACNTGPQRTAKQDLVEMKVIVFQKSEHRSEDLLGLIDDTFARIGRGEDFRALATRVSDDDSVNYADHLVDTATLIRPVQKALRRLEPGETSDLIVTDKYYYIIKFVRRPEVTPTALR